MALSKREKTLGGLMLAAIAIWIIVQSGVGQIYQTLSSHSDRLAKAKKEFLLLTLFLEIVTLKMNSTTEWLF